MTISGIDISERKRRVQYAALSHRFALIVVTVLATSVFGFAQSVPPSRTPEASQTPDGSESKDVSLPSLVTPLKPQTQEGTYNPITPRQRLRWFITNTIGPPHLAGGVVVSAFGTALNRPKEYGPHWGGFADRYGMRLTGIVTGNTIEASVGLLLREDPRYFRVQDRTFKARISHVVRLTFTARRYDGSYGPAYARYMAVAGNNFLSNTWRVQSEANVQNAILRTAEGFAGRMAVNAFEEFWPNVKERVFQRHN